MSGPASVTAGSSAASARGRNGASGRASRPRRLVARGWQWVCRSKGRSGSGITLDVSGPAQPSGSRAKWVFALVLLLAITAVAVAEYSTGRGLIPIAWLAVGPLLGSLVLSARITAVLAGWSMLLGLGLMAGAPRELGGLASHLGVMVLLAAFAVANAVLRTAAQRRLSQVRAVARVAQSALLREVPARVTAGRLAAAGDLRAPAAAAADRRRRPAAAHPPFLRDPARPAPRCPAIHLHGERGRPAGFLYRGLDDLGPAERDHLIVVDDRVGELRFRHPMIKSVVVERSTHDERREAHLRLAERFADQPERRGHHLAEAAFARDEDIAAAVEHGAHSTLQRGNVVGAISRLLRAADLSPNPTDRSRRLADAAYVGAHSAGQLDSASELLHDAHRRDPTLGETLHAAAATAYLLLNSEGDAETTHRLLTVADRIRARRARPRPRWTLGRAVHAGAGVPLRRAHGVLGAVPRCR